MGFINNKTQEGLNSPFTEYLQDEVVEGKYHYVRITFSILTLLILFIDTLIGGPPLNEMLNYVCFLFLGDFLYRLYLSKNKWKFIKISWIDLLLCWPFYQLTWLTVGVTIRCVKTAIEFVLETIHSAFSSMLIFGGLLIMFATVSIMQFEILPECNIKTPFDAMWWSLCTITTVGYGDKFPITDGGRIVSTILMISGIGLFGALVGYVSTFFTDKEKNNNTDIDTIEELSKQLIEIKEELKKKIDEKI